MAGAVGKALSKDWLSIDSQANAGSGTTPQTQQAVDVPAPVVPTLDHAIAPDMPDVAPASDTILYEPSNWAGAWPTFTQGNWTQGPAQAPDGIRHGEPDPYASNLAKAEGTVRVTESGHAGYDAHSQMTDNAGWQINTPSGRTAVRRLLGASGIGVEDFWYKTAPRPTPKRLARGAADVNLPSYAVTSMGGPGDIAYSTPAPPQTSQAPAAQAGGTDWQWGGF